MIRVSERRDYVCRNDSRLQAERRDYLSRNKAFGLNSQIVVESAIP